MVNVKDKVYLCSGKTIRVRDESEVQTYDQLPPKTYTVKLNENTGEFFLEEIDDFTLPEKIYGTNNNYAKRILDTFADRQGSTGVLLNGIKGAGKTLLAKQTSVYGKELGYPTIVINRDWHGDNFNAFIQSISTPTIILFDEFEKIYDYKTQRQILTLFDGVYNSRKLFLVTTNEERDISTYMRNRPGRIYYSFNFDTLGQDFIEEFLDDRLQNKDRKEEVMKYTTVFSFFNFDMLAAVVEEMNRYDESLGDVLEVLNIIPENKSSDTHSVTLEVNNELFVINTSYQGFQPNTFEYYVHISDGLPQDLRNNKKAMEALTGSVSPSDYNCLEFNSSHIAQFDQRDNRFVYELKTPNNGSFRLHVKRNPTVADWKYHPDAI